MKPLPLVLVLAASISASAAADDRPLDIPERYEVSVVLRASHLQASALLSGDGESVELNDLYDDFSTSDHRGWLSSASLGELELGFALSEGIGIGASLPFVRVATGGDFRPEGTASFVPETFSRSGLGDIALFADFHYDYERYTLEGGIEPTTIRIRVFGDLPTGAAPELGALALGTGSGRLEAGALADGYQRRGRLDLQGQLGYTYLADQSPLDAILQSELGLGAWATPWLRVSAAVLAHTYGSAPANLSSYGRYFDPADTDRSHRSSAISLSPQLLVTAGPSYWLSVGMRGRPAQAGLGQLDVGYIVWGRRALTGSLPPATLTLGGRF